MMINKKDATLVPSRSMSTPATLLTRRQTYHSIGRQTIGVGGPPTVDGPAGPQPGADSGDQVAARAGYGVGARQDAGVTGPSGKPARRPSFFQPLRRDG